MAISCSYNDEYGHKRVTFDCKLELHKAKLPIGGTSRRWCKLLSSVWRKTTRPPQQLHQWYVKRKETKTAVSLSAKKKNPKKHAKGPEKTATTKDRGFFFSPRRRQKPFSRHPENSMELLYFCSETLSPHFSTSICVITQWLKAKSKPFQAKTSTVILNLSSLSEAGKIPPRRGWKKEKQSENGTKRHFRLIIQVTLENGLFHCRFNGPVCNVWRKLLAWNGIEYTCVYL